MKIVHTSDWHLGRRLDGESLSQPHEKFLEWLSADLLPEEKPDLLVVAGDIYDRAIPPTDAVELFEESLARISSLGIKVLITSGNHDSRVRLGANTRFLSGVGMHYRTKLNQVDRPVEIEKDDFTFLAYGIPYLEPDVDAGSQSHQWEVEANQTAVLEEAMRRIHLDIEIRRNSSRKPIRTLIASHAFVQGASSSDSERNTKVGGLGQADAAVFKNIDYVAMGHLHGQQKIVGPSSTIVRYSGSPIPFSFSERNHEKQVFTVSFDAAGIAGEIIGAAVPQVRKMVQIEDSLAEIQSSKYQPSDDWVKVVLIDKDVPINVVDTLKRKYPHLLELDIRRQVESPSGLRSSGSPLHKLTPTEVTKRFVGRVTNQEPTEQIAAAIDLCCQEVSKESIQVNK